MCSVLFSLSVRVLLMLHGLVALTSCTAGGLASALEALIAVDLSFPLELVCTQLDVSAVCCDPCKGDGTSER